MACTAVCMHSAAILRGVAWSGRQVIYGKRIVVYVRDKRVVEWQSFSR
jgi:hypothetical protein